MAKDPSCIGSAKAARKAWQVIHQPSKGGQQAIPVYTVLSRASAHGCSQLKRQKVWVGGYMEKVLEWFNYPRARAHPGCEVNCQGVPHRGFVKASPTVEKAVLCYKADRLVASLPSFHSVQLSLAVCKFHAAGKECCERGHGRGCVRTFDA